MSAPVRVGIVGLGRLGRRHAENLAWRVPGASLVAACSPVAEEREWARANLPELALHDDYETLLADKSIDAVWLVTPTSLHPAQIIAALRAGKHVFCEKPLSLDLDECDRVIEESARHPELQVMIGFVRRFDPSYRDAFEKSERARSAGRSWCARKPATRTTRWLFREVRADLGRPFPRLQRPRHRPCALASRQSPAEARIRERHDRDSRRTARMRRHR